jgi:(p)ppGpp synthase/HD superfamily hydrolase
MTPMLKTAMDLDSRIRAAYEFAEVAHRGQLRPTVEDPNTPYIVHPVEVAGIVASVPRATSEMLMAALLHDVLEDTDAKAVTIQRLFGDTVLNYVMHLTDYYTPENFPDQNRAIRKDKEMRRLAMTPPAVQTIKLADGLSNTPSIALNRASFMPIYGPEKRAVWNVLDRGDAVLRSRLDGVLKFYGY